MLKLVFTILLITQSNCFKSPQSSYFSPSYGSQETSYGNMNMNMDMGYYAELQEELIFIPTPIITTTAIVAPIVTAPIITIPQVSRVSLTTSPPQIPRLIVPSIPTQNIIASPPSIPFVTAPLIPTTSIVGSPPSIPFIAAGLIPTTSIITSPPVAPIIKQAPSAININLITPPPQIPVLKPKPIISPATIVPFPSSVSVINVPKIPVSSIISLPPNIPLISHEEEFIFRKIEFCYEEVCIPPPPEEYVPPQEYAPPEENIPPEEFICEELVPVSYNTNLPAQERRYKKTYSPYNFHNDDKIKYVNPRNNKNYPSSHSKTIVNNHKINYESRNNSKKDNYKDHNLYDICPGWWEKSKINLDDIICENTLFYIKNCFLRDPISEKKIHASKVNFKTLRGKTLAYSDWFCKRDNEEWKFDFDSCKWINAENGREADTIH